AHMSLAVPTNNPLVTLSGVNGTFTVTPTGIFGAALGSVTVAAGAGFGFSGDLALGFNTTAAQHVVAVYGTPTDQDDDITLNAATVNGPYVTIAGSNIHLTLGPLSLSGNFSFTKDGANLHLAFSEVSIALPDEQNPVISLTDIQGDFTVTPQGVYGAASGSV